MEVLTACRRGLVVVRRVPPHFSILPESTEVASGGAVNLTCVAVGSPMPQVKWRLGAVELTPENSVPIGKNVLQLTDVRETATYTCVAASDLGNIEYDAEVRVKGKRCRLAMSALICPITAGISHMQAYNYLYCATFSSTSYSVALLLFVRRERHRAFQK